MKSMKEVYEEMLSYFKNASEDQLNEDIKFLESQEKTDVLASEYAEYLNNMIEAAMQKVISKTTIECDFDSDNHNLSEQFYLAA